MNMLINQILLAIAILTTGVVYGTDVFHAIVVKKAVSLSSDSAIADLMGHTHLIADKRMPLIGATSLVSSLLITVLNYNSALAIYSGVALIALISHLIIYLRVAKPINVQMSAAAMAQKTPADIRSLQLRWDSVISYRALLLTIAMGALISGILVTSGK
ncbi:DUF1772 domain-containing protein [Mucilaginibacter aquaedulcis]|uniref:DUF1772 domain-containing protein n=1 Tax=Mucilaginibacter aquaedulcis TaxID=1187081 RepID=UPI0025B628FE|nr:DUF1772 domain-containing protein [Mucilaginibacter aquaedulcis]MDN3550859.1 DUF1772 domain-containing protein [Mucilaginibacter aquaedulcis]